MRFELLVVIVVEALNGSLLYGAVHPINLGHWPTGASLSKGDVRCRTL